MIRVRDGAGRAVGCLLLVLMLTAASVVTGLSRPARAADGTPVQVVLAAVTPSVLQPRGTLTVRFDVVNNSGRDLDQVSVKLRVSRELTLRGDLAAPDSWSNRDIRDGTATKQFPRIPAGTTQSETFTVPVDKMGLGTDPAVYAVTAQAVDGGSEVGSSHVLMPWVPKDALKNLNLKKTQVGVLWPLIDQPRRDGTTLGDAEQTPVFTNDGLTDELARDGRLSQLVQSGQQIPGVTWVVDPDLLDTVRAMEQPYRVAPPDRDPAVEKDSGEGDSGRESDTATAKAAPRTEEETEPGRGGPAATDWLQQLRAAVADDTVVALPYADTDVATVAHAARTGSKTDLMPQLNAAVERGRSTAGEVLQKQVRTDVTWPIAGAVDTPVLDTAKATGSSVVVASGASMPPRNSKLDHTSSARFQVGPSTTALVTDPRIDVLLDEGARGPDGQLRLQQALVAELFTIAMEQPALQRALFIVPPRNFDAAVGRALAGAVSVATGAEGWAEVASLDELAETEVGEERTMRAYPSGLTRTEFSDRYLKTVPELQRRVDAFAAILSERQRIEEPYDPAVLRTLSVAWRGETMDADTYRLDVTRSLRVLEQLVRIAPKSSVTLSGDSGTIPVTIINGLQQPITIRLDVVSRQPNRLSLTQPHEVRIPGGRTLAIPVEARSAANGKVLVDVRILTPDGKDTFGPTQTFFVNTTSIDGITLGIIGVIAALLALFSLRAYIKRRKGPSDGEDSAERTGGGDDEGEAHGPGGPVAGGPGGHARIEGGTRRHASRDRPEDHHAPA
ncbi:DUF6049 family protein [Yinghuangia sp. YIM S09857]|uniref:DUF6049 family protein n=1 Tax=Yinghuangia sp. YIM S09857 TaxID=3436929 RepID=UPI003F52CC64